MEILTTAELRQGNRVIGLNALSNDEIAHLAMIVGKLFVHPSRKKLGDWLLDSFDHELERRDSNGAIEGGMLLLPCDLFNEAELVDAAFACCLLRDVSTLSEAERRFIGSIQRNLFINTVSRLRAKTGVAPQMMTKADVADLIGISDHQVTALVKRGVLPEPVRLSNKLLRWHTDEVIQAIQAMK